MTDQTPAQRLVSSIHAGWNLGNSLDAMKRGAAPGEIVAPREAETAWHNPPVSRGLIRAVRDAGFDAVRLPVTWAQHLDRDGKADPAWMDRVAEVAGWILDEGMACFVNVHHDAGAHGWLQAGERWHEIYGGRFDGLWLQIAERFANTGERLVFEAFNEMLDGRDNWGGEADEKQIENLTDSLAVFSKKHDAPLVIGEFGSEDKGNEEARERHAAFFTASARHRGIPCLWWDCGRFALFDRLSARVIHPGIVRALTGR